MIYAPVVIITCNRYEHLKRCLESLERNTDAEKTEIFISIDFPPSEKYVEGNQKIINYLYNRKFIFKKMNIYVQKENMGSSQNFLFVSMKAYEKYDRLIFSEDDNEFSPNFLQYMDKGLDIFQDNLHVAAISAYNDNLVKSKDEYNVEKSFRWYAWGVAMWKEKDELLRKNVNFETFDKTAHDIKAMCKLFFQSKLLFCSLVGYLIDFQEKEIPFQDIPISIYIATHDMCVIIPSVSKVKNWGFDGSGEHCGINESQTEKKIDQSNTFSYLWNESEGVNIKAERAISRQLGWVRKEQKLWRTPRVWIMYICLGKKGYWYYRKITEKIVNKLRKK